MASFLGAIFQKTRISSRIGVGLLAASTILSGGSASAEPWSSSWSSYRATLEDADGTPLRTFQQDGTTFVLGYDGERFAIRLVNNSDRRVEAVVSVDGRDAVSGRVADYVRERGYVVPPHGSVRIEGFRQSYDSVAAFRFTDPHNSYSSRMGTPENVGIIGVAFFPERARPPIVRRRPLWPRDEVRERQPYSDPIPHRRSSPPPAAPPRGSSAPKASADGALGGAEERGRAGSSAPSRLGTEYAESRESRVTEVPFERESSTRPASVVRVRYDDAEGLMARGINVYPDAYWTYSEPPYPRAFPESEWEYRRFAPPPP